MSRRTVRATSAFLERLDSQLPSDRGADGSPSAHDFLEHEYPTARRRFEEAFDTLPEVIPGIPFARMVIQGGTIVRAYAIQGLELQDGSVELFEVLIDAGWDDAYDAPNAHDGGD